jgi:hypothetical protein
MKSPYEELMNHAKHFGRFDVIPGHKRGKITPPAPKTAEAKPESAQAEVGWQDVQNLRAPKDGNNVSQ